MPIATLREFLELTQGLVVGSGLYLMKVEVGVIQHVSFQLVIVDCSNNNE